jgi:O-antigen biosynthesis protein
VTPAAGAASPGADSPYIIGGVPTDAPRGVSVVIPTWDGRGLLERFLPSVIAAAAGYALERGAPTELIVVDDGSRDGSVEWLTARGFALEEAPGGSAGGPGFASVRRVLRNPANVGFGEACNRGVAAARHDLVLLLNNDVELAPDAVAPLVERFDDPRVFAAHCRIVDFDSGRERGTGKVGGFARGFLRVHRSYEPARPDAPCLYSIFASGGSALFDRAKFLSLGGFDGLLAPFYWEDVDLSYRAWKRGHVVLYEPRAVARHRFSSTTGRLDGRRVRRIEQRNHLLWHWVNLHDPRLVASHLAWLAVATVTAPFRWRWGFLAALGGALARLPAAYGRRREERRAVQRADREVLALFQDLAARRDVFVYDRDHELEAFRARDHLPRPVLG